MPASDPRERRVLGPNRLAIGAVCSDGRTAPSGCSGRDPVLCTHAHPTRAAVEERSSASIFLKVPLRFPHRLHRTTKTTSFVRALAHRVNVYRIHPQAWQGTPASCAGAFPMFPVR